MLKPDELCVVNLHTMWIHSFTAAAEAPAAIEAAKRSTEESAERWAKNAEKIQ